MLLNIVQFRGWPPQPKNYPALNIPILEMEKLCELDPRRELRNLGRMLFLDPLLCYQVSDRVGERILEEQASWLGQACTLETKQVMRDDIRLWDMRSLSRILPWMDGHSPPTCA